MDQAVGTGCQSPSLFDWDELTQSRPPDLPVSIQDRFDQFDRDHPQVYELFKRFSLEMLAAGRTRYGAKGVVERMRWHTAVKGGDDFKLNNIWTSRLARRLAADDPRFADFFEFRELRA